jgi:hypothetical protein
MRVLGKWSRKSYLNPTKDVKSHKTQHGVQNAMLGTNVGKQRLPKNKWKEPGQQGGDLHGTW